VARPYDHDVTCRKGLRRHEGGGTDQGGDSGTEDSFHGASPFGWFKSNSEPDHEIVVLMQVLTGET
jgi:hypothetical protein